MASRKDVAREAGVSATSVSYYINKNGYVSNESAKKIQAAIEKLNYCPNQIAKSLKTKDNRQFIFLCNEILNPFFTQLFSSAMNAAYQENYTVLFSTVVDDDSYLRQLCSYQPSGIFLPNGRFRRSVLDVLCRSNIPIIMLSDVIWDDVPPSVTQLHTCPDLVYPIIVEHLLSQGYQHILFLSTMTTPQDHVNEKTRAVINALGDRIPYEIVYGHRETKSACQYILKNWKQPDVPQAIICSNDAIAHGVVYGLSSLGVRIPEDVGVVGHDDTLLAKFNSPSISSVSIGTEHLGHLIVESLIKRTKGISLDDHYITPKFIPRCSSLRLPVM